MRGVFSWVLASLAVTVLTGFAPAATAQEHFNKGPKACEECHEAEVRVYEGSEHGKSYKEFHKKSEAQKLAKEVGGKKSAKRNPVCGKCHYTMVAKSDGKTPRARASTSCESCHGPSSKWLDIHNEFGEYTEDNEPAAHKAKRLAASRDAGMIYSSMHYEIAENCMSCHGLARSDVDDKDLSALLAKNHPVAKEFELVRYSQGTVRHRFYRPDISVNKEMTRAELSRLFVTGQAAKLVSASAAAGRGDAAYKALQSQRVAEAKRVLSAVRSVPEAAALVSSPTRSAAMKLVAAIKGKDLSGDVGSMLPSKSSYK